ncbi:MAG: TetR family transcriptional regulator [Alphaproteobacteria bacterium]|nr:TetR family transcriptional regulator [Alphaproteobacteria bacterium]
MRKQKVTPAVKAAAKKAAAGRRTNAELTAKTRTRLLAAARGLFIEVGFKDAAGEEVVARAGLTRGALYYQFGDMKGLFRAVLLELLGELAVWLDRETMRRAPAGEGTAHSVAELSIGVDLLLEAFARKDVADLLLRDAPVVLGAPAWEALLREAGLIALLEHALGHWAEAGLIEPARIAPLARILFGATTQAGLAIAAASNRKAESAAMRAAMAQLIDGLKRSAP